MNYRCTKCSFDMESKEDVNFCLKCGSPMESYEKPKKRVARIEGTIKGLMDVVIHEDGHIEFLFFSGEHIVNSKDYKVLADREITDEEYENL